MVTDKMGIKLAIIPLVLRLMLSEVGPDLGLVLNSEE